MDPMTAGTLVADGTVEWAAAGQPFPGEALSGDMVVVADRRYGALIAVVDALGHGAEAAGVAAAAAAALQRHAEEPVLPLMRAVHETLRGSRGAVISLGLIEGRNAAVTWLGVGNVQGWVLRSASRPAGLPVREMMLLRGGIVGVQLPPLYAAIVPIVAGDLIVFASDGIGADFMVGVRADAPVVETAEQILRHHGMANDDAIVVVARYRGLGEGRRPD
ncbi:MAG: SpoIIE family protein phosphatase [Terriglobales bacterium]